MNLLPPTAVTVSGFSSGGMMTANMLAMFSGNISGGAIISGFGPCASRENKEWCEGEPIEHPL